MGFIVFLTHYIVAYLRLYRRIQITGTKIDPANPYIPKGVLNENEFKVVCCLGFRVPFAFRVIHPIIVLPYDIIKKLPGEDARPVIYHEMMHIKRKDTFLLLVATFLRCVYWFNPFVHLAFSRMKVDQDIACDEFVAKYLHGTGTKGYIDVLKLVASNFERIPFGISQFCETSLGKRVRAITNVAKSTKGKTTKAVFVTVLVGIFTLAAALFIPAI